MLDGYGWKRAIVSIGFAAAVTALYGQSPEYDERRYYDRYDSEYSWREPETDTILFYRAVQATEDIFADVVDYDLSFVSFSRRGERIYRSRSLFDGIRVRSEYRSMLDNLQIPSRRFSGLRHSGIFVGGADGGLEYYSDLSEPSGGSAGIGFSDRGYLTAVHASMSGLLGRGLSVTGYVSGRTGRDMHIKGVFANGLDAGVRLSKHWNYTRRVTVAAMFSPSERGMRRGSVEEAFRLTGDRLYNPSWGYYNGKIRNANVRRLLLPSVVASYDDEVSRHTRITVAAGMTAGTSRYSGLEWYDAATPLPDNYHYLPSYYSGFLKSESLAEVWRNGDTRYTQIDWDELYRRNCMSGDGHAIYAVSDRVERITDLELHAAAVTEAGPRMTIGYGVHLFYGRSRNYRRMRDLLGAGYIVDIDRYLVDDAMYGNRLQNDLRNPDRKVTEGDRYGYDYALVNRRASAFATMEYQHDRWRFDFAAEAGGCTVYRHGYYEKELFPGSASSGRSRKVRLSPYSLKASFGYSFTPRHFLELCASASGEVPDAEDMFLQSQYNNRIADDVRLCSVWAAELNYTFLHSVFDLRATLFAKAVKGDREVSHIYDDLSSSYADMVVAGIDRLHMGAEIAADIRISRHWTASAAFTAGRYTYISDPSVSLYADSDNRVILERAAARMGDCFVGNAPLLAGKADIAYMNRGWGVRLTLSYAGFRYVEAEPVRRTDRMARQGSLSREMFLRFVTQERLPDAATMDASVWKTFWLRRDYSSRTRIVVSLSAKNLIGSTSVYSARESARVRRMRVADGYYYYPFETIYLYSYPRTFRLAVSLRF